MSDGAELDIRWPIGLLFALIGLLVFLYGATAKQPLRPLGYNVNLWWGLVMLAFGAFMIAGAIREMTSQARK
ncbi:MAG: hypothetical protein ACR2IF_11020 [Terriglobales bacterium]